MSTANDSVFVECVMVELWYAHTSGGVGMKKVRITVMRKACYPDLMEKYENPIEHACDIEEGAVFIANGWQRPEGLCESAWESMSPFVMGLAHG
jgi:uncharacterized repeat protein (TIGR04076 family)